MATSNDLLIKERSVIEFLAAEGCSAANIHARMKTVYGEMCIIIIIIVVIVIVIIIIIIIILIFTTITARSINQPTNQSTPIHQSLS
ncbi:hypothetical protein PoB_000503700 [Plakobranchus ocellatus]|uniref:Uncharacterized protein n=1 Tax=Plakobranchus ocellatus TaxID=259542 RepID=A0AAV3Y8T1_9GAST|nr:hypothetical protein PoB_000503700 [Plakobranchus ocellatus]